VNSIKELDTTPKLIIVVMICNYAYQKLFPFIIACPHSLLLLPIPIFCPQETPLYPHDQYVVKLPPALETIVRYDVKLQPHPDLA
jgi:hypothetical protein